MAPQPGDREYAPAACVLTRRVGDELVLLNTTTEVYFGLDPIGTTMWEALVDHRTIEAALAVLVKAYDVEESRLRRDLADLVAALAAQGLLMVAEE